MRHTVLVLARHGQTVWHRENRYTGTSDVDLTADGREQAQHLARWAGLERPDVIACSPLRRAVETARPTARLLGLEPVICPDLREVDFGVAEGRTMAEIHADDPEMTARFQDDPVAHHFPEADDPAHAADRAATTLRRLAAQHPGATVLVVAHNTVFRLALCQLLGIDVRRYRTVFPRLDNGALTRLAVPLHGDGQVSLVSLNVPVTAHLDGAPTASDDGAGAMPRVPGRPRTRSSTRTTDPRSSP